MTARRRTSYAQAGYDEGLDRDLLDAGSSIAADQFLAFLPKGTPPELITAIRDAARAAFDRHGASAFTAPRESAIAHEVGHAIVGAHEGLAIREITISSRSVPAF